jgi:hypothetical protein
MLVSRVAFKCLELGHTFIFRLSVPLIIQVGRWAAAEAVSRNSSIKPALRDVALLEGSPKLMKSNLK